MRHTPCGCCPPGRAGGAKLFSGFTGGSIFAVTPQLCLRRLVLASSISLAPPQAAGLIHFAARPLQTANATLVCCLVPFLSCQKKVCKKEAQDAFYSAYARKTIRSILRIFVPPSVKERPNGRP